MVVDETLDPPLVSPSIPTVPLEQTESWEDVAVNSDLALRSNRRCAIFVRTSQTSSRTCHCAVLLDSASYTCRMKRLLESDSILYHIRRNKLSRTKCKPCFDWV